MPPMLDNRESLVAALPDVVLALGVLGEVVLGFLRPVRARRAATVLAIATCAGALVALAATAGPARALFHGLLARDALGDFFKVVVLVGTGIVVLLAEHAREIVDPARGERDAAELCALLLGAALGSSLLATSSNLLTLYLALELTSIASYLLTGFVPGSRRSAEAALKYVIYGGVASASMLYGLSLLYGLAGTLDVQAVRVAATTAPPAALVAAVVLSLAGLGYKIAIAPFHMWCPDVYEGAPTPVAAFLSVVPKAAGFALLVRFLGAGTSSSWLATEGAARSPWVLLLLGLAVVTMTLGNLAALGQRNVKRLLAYSSIAHAGYLLLGVAAGAPAGIAAVAFYAVAYLLMNLCAFGVAIAFAESGAGESIDGWGGLGYRAPLPALALTVALFALTGLPPTVGFVGKYYLFAAVIGRGLAGGGGAYHAAALIAVLNSAVSLYYYARILRALYLVRPVGPRLHVAPVAAGVVAALSVAILILGVYWAPLAGAAEASVASSAGISPGSP